jgi:hypothetical protein
MKRFLFLFSVLSACVGAQTLPTTRMGNLIVTGTATIPSGATLAVASGGEVDVAGIIVLDGTTGVLRQDFEDNRVIIDEGALSAVNLVSFDRATLRPNYLYLYDESASLETELFADRLVTASTTINWTGSNGILTKQGDGSGLTGIVLPARTITAGTGLTGGGDLSANRTLALTGQALALHNLGSNGLVARTGSGTVAARTITGTAPITVTNGDGVIGNPTVAVSAATTSAAGVVQLATSAEAITGTDAAKAVTSATLAAINPRGPAEYLISTSLTTANMTQVPGPRAYVAGLPELALIGWLDVPTIVPGTGGTSNTFYLAGFGDGAATHGHSGSVVAVSLNNSGGLDVVSCNTSFNNRRQRRFANFISTFGGRRVWVEVLLYAGSATEPVLKVDGVAQTNGSTTTAGTPPDWIPTTPVFTAWSYATFWPLGNVIPLLSWVIGHPAVAESESWRITRRPPAWVAVGGWAGEMIVSSQDRDFSSAGTGNWTALIGSASVANTSNALDLTLAGSGASGVRLATAGIVNYVPNARARVTFTASLVSGPTAPMRAGFSGGTELNFTVSSGSPTAYVADIYLRSPIPADNLLTLYAPSSNGSVVRFDDISVKYLGAISLPDILPINALGDGTVIGDNPSRLANIQPITTRHDWQLTARTATSGNQQILGGSILDPARDVLDSIEQIPATGTPTTTVGSSSGGAQYKASAALAAGINTPALVTRKTASPNVWVGSSSADSIRTTITGHTR